MTAGSTDVTSLAPSTSTEQTSDIGAFEPVEGVPGVTDNAINFAVLGTGASNPLGYCLLDCYRGGVQTYFDYQNGLGGVHGRKLTISRVDDDEVANTKLKALELIDDKSVFAIFGAPLLYSGYSDIGASGIPLYTTLPASGDANGFDNIYIPGGTQCIDCANPASVWGAKIAGGTKAAALGFGDSQASKDCVNRTESDFAKYGAGTGVEFVYKNDGLPFGLPNGLGPEVTAMKDAGVDFITTCIDQNSVLTLEQELERQGMSGVVVALPQGYADSDFISTNAELLEGDILAVSTDRSKPTRVALISTPCSTHSKRVAHRSTITPSKAGRSANKRQSCCRRGPWRLTCAHALEHARCHGWEQHGWEQQHGWEVVYPLCIRRPPWGAPRIREHLVQMEPKAGIEPATYALRVRCSAD